MSQDATQIHELAALLPSATPLDTLHWAWRQVSPEDRLCFLTEMLTPQERRALLIGFDDEEEASS